MRPAPHLAGGWYLGNLGSVPVYLHPGALFLVLIAFWWGGGVSGGAAILLVLVLAILLHEVGHAVAARLRGARDISITITTLGGLCTFDRPAGERPWSDVFISAAGPAMNYLLAGLGWLAWSYLLARHPDVILYPNGSLTMWGLLVFFQMNINLVLGIFNSLPIYPLDGGNIAYSLLRGLRVPERRARAVSLGLAWTAGIAVLAFLIWISGGLMAALTHNPLAFFLIVLLLFEATRTMRS